MFSIVISVAVTTWIAVMLFKKVYAPAVLMIGGLFLIVVAALFSTGEVINPKWATGLEAFDIFEQIRRMFSTRTAGLGLQIMMIAGYSKYMEKLKASIVLCELFASPLRRLKSPMLVFALAFIITQFLSMFVPSGAGMALLTMITFYPILIKVGLSRLTALAVVASTRNFAWGPASPNANLAAQTINMDITQYFVQFHTPFFLFLMVCMLVVHLFVQPYWDRKEGPDLEVQKYVAQMEQEKDLPPLIYAVLPVLPLFLIIGCSPLFTNCFGLSYKIKMNVGNAMFICTFIALFFEMLRLRSVKEALNNWKAYFEAMGKIFTLVVCLIVAGEVFARGLIVTGALDTLIEAAKNAGLGGFAMTTAAGLITWVSAFLMGSGNAAFFSFSHMVPALASGLHTDPAVMMVILDLYSCYGRTMSPIFGAIIAIAAMAGVSPFQISKRVMIPAIACGLLTMPFAYFYFGYGM